jgi:hypothetical protein
MWDLRLLKPFDSLSLRKIFLFVATLLVTIFAYILINAPTTYAIDATWKGDALVYNGNQYTKLPQTSSSNLPSGNNYGYIDAQNVAHVITFSQGADLSNTNAADYSEYNFTPPGTFTDRRATQGITLAAQDNTSQTASACDSSFTANMGWIICPTTNFLARAMDWLFGIVSGFLKVAPLQTSSDGALYRAWDVMRSFANVAFVIGFLLIIYSQLTSFGISNYGVKKTLPRLIVAAILVNVSYWVCAVAIDVSNILGYSIQGIFMGLHNLLVDTGGNSWQINSWESVSGFILSGGAAGGAAIAGGYALAAGTVGGALYLFLPILVAVLMGILVALLVMAARQAIIVILVIIAPLAFVAYLLPNTEKYFDKWRGLFMTMLMVFPIFSVLFGGAQVAGTAIIKSADSINMIILGMAVQIAPLVITPFLVKFSGSLLGRIAGMVNNPNKGAIDRTRKWATERATQHKGAVLAQRKPGLMARTTQSIDNRRRNREGSLAKNTAFADARWAQSQKYSDIQQGTLEANQLKETGEASAQRRYEDAKRTNPWIQSTDFQARSAKQELETSQSETNLGWENAKAGHTDGLVTAHEIARSGLDARIRSTTERSQAAASALHAAQHMQQRNFAEELERDPGLRTIAGGIDPSGALKAEARAMGEISKASKDDVEAGVQLLNYKAIKENSTLKAMSAKIANEVMAGSTAYDANEIEAAFEAQAADGAIPILEQARGSTAIDQSMLTRVFARNAGTLKQKGGFHLQANPNLNVNKTANFTKEMDMARMSSLASTSAANLKDLKEAWINVMADRISKNTDSIVNNTSAADLQKIYDGVFKALDSPEIFATVTDRAPQIQAIEKALRGAHGGNRPANGI